MIAFAQESPVWARFSGEDLSWLHVASARAVHVKAGTGPIHNGNNMSLVWKAMKVLLKVLKCRTFLLPSVISFSICQCF